MFTVLSITFTTSFLDSLNPIAIAQQLSLQAVSHRKKDIRGFILGIGLTNFLAGLGVFYGLNQWLRPIVVNLLENQPKLLPLASLFFGAIILGILFKKQPQAAQNTTMKKGLRFPQLFGLGVAACLLELTSALPYFAFLTFLTRYQLSLLTLVALLLIYNLIYSAPLIAIYFFTIYFEAYLENFYQKFTRIMEFLLQKILPPLLFLAALGLIIYGIWNFFI